MKLLAWSGIFAVELCVPHFRKDHRVGEAAKYGSDMSDIPT